MTDDVRPILDTLFYPFDIDAIQRPMTGQSAVFLNAYKHEGFVQFESAKHVYQVFKPEAVRLEQQGLKATPDIDDISGDQDVVLVLLPKNQIEAQGLIAHALKSLKNGGVLAVAAGNKAGGSRIAKRFKAFGIEDFQQETRNRARVVWATIDGYDEQHVQQAILAAAVRRVCDEQYQSQAGVYGWDKIDKGSALLAECLPEQGFKNGADFGCGYGYLSLAAQPKFDCKSWACIDADWRAVEACKANMDAYGFEADYLWGDLTGDCVLAASLDIIVMNPPFHEGQKGKPEIGNAFISNASKALKRKGELWMVANNHLPYERALNDSFFTVEKIAERQGFKVYKAVK